MQETGASTSEELTAADKPVRYLGKLKNDGTGAMGPKTGQGAAFVSHVHSVRMVELQVDTESGDVKILKMTS